MSRNIQLLVIDPQNDFCDLPTAWQPIDAITGARTAPSLPVAGAHADMQRVAAFIRSHATQLDAITVTLDSHQRIDIAHPGFWQQADGRAVAPFTPITAAQVRAGAFAPRNPTAPAPHAGLPGCAGSPRALHPDGVARALRDRQLGPRRARRRAGRLRRLAAAAPARGGATCSRAPTPGPNTTAPSQAEVPTPTTPTPHSTPACSPRSTAPTCC